MRVNLARWKQVALVGYGILLGAALVVACLGRWSDSPGWACAAMLVAGVGWWTLVAAADHGAITRRRELWVGAVLLRVVGLASGLALTDDPYRYLWEGEVLLEGRSPYALAPNAVELEELRVRLPALASVVNHTEVPAVYPPLTQAAGLGAAAVCRWFSWRPEVEGVFLLRVGFGLCDLLVLVPLVRLIERRKRSLGLAAAWAFAPLAAFEFAGSAHFDSLGILLLVAALAALDSRQGASGTDSKRGHGAAALLAAAALVKYLPLVALPAFARAPGGARRVGWVLAFVAVGFAPLLLLQDGLHGLGSGLGQYALRWEGSSVLHRWIEPLFRAWLPLDESLLDARRATRAFELLVWVSILFLARRRWADPVRFVALAIGAYLLLSPTLHPWYVLWLVPFLGFERSAAWRWLVMAVPLAYLPLAGWQAERVWIEPPWQWPLLALPILVLLALDLWGPLRHPRADSRAR